MRFFAAILLISAAAPGSTIVSTFGLGGSYHTENTGTRSMTVGGAGAPFYYSRPEDLAVPFTTCFEATLDSLLLPVFSLAGDGTVNVFLDSGDIPGSTLEAFRITGLSGSPALYTLTSQLTPILRPDTLYWIVMTVDDPAADVEWSWNDQGFDGVWARFDGGAWGYYGKGANPTPAFSVNGFAPRPATPLMVRSLAAVAAPEPAGFVLAAGGLLAMAVLLEHARRRR